jgi:hypothetical protein
VVGCQGNELRGRRDLCCMLLGTGNLTLPWGRGGVITFRGCNLEAGVVFLVLGHSGSSCSRKMRWLRGVYVLVGCRRKGEGAFCAD